MRVRKCLSRHPSDAPPARYPAIPLSHGPRDDPALKKKVSPTPPLENPKHRATTKSYQSPTMTPIPTASASDPSTRPLPSKKRPRNPSREPCQGRHSRIKLSPESSTASEPSISEDSALIPTSLSSDSTAASEADTDSESELSDSSSDPSSSDESDSDGSALSDNAENSEIETDGEEVTNLRKDRGGKPDIKMRKDETATDLRSRLKSFLPQLAASNEELEAERKAGTLKQREIDKGEDGDGEYIEMVGFIEL